MFNAILFVALNSLYVIGLSVLCYGVIWCLQFGIELVVNAIIGRDDF